MNLSQLSPQLGIVILLTPACVTRSFLEDNTLQGANVDACFIEGSPIRRLVKQQRLSCEIIFLFPFLQLGSVRNLLVIPSSDSQRSRKDSSDIPSGSANASESFSGSGSITAR
jgi:hypothetical protein